MENMGKEEFAEKVKRYAQTRLGSGYHVQLKEIAKNNGIMRLGLMIRKKGRNITPAIYLEDFQKRYEEGVPAGEIIERILELYEESMPSEDFDTGILTDFERIKDRITYRLINAEKNRELLGQIPHKRFLDLAICFSYSFCEKGLGIGSVLVYNNHVAAWKTDEDTLMRLAERNTARLRPVKLMELGKLIEDLADCLGAEGARGAGEGKPGGAEGLCVWPEGPSEGPEALVLTNTEGVYGAAAILYPDMLHDLRERAGGGFFLLPSSVHEFLVLPDRGAQEPEELIRMVREVNASQVPEEEVLSENIYRYDAAADTLSVLDQA